MWFHGSFHDEASGLFLLVGRLSTLAILSLLMSNFLWVLQVDSGRPVVLGVAMMADYIT